MRILPILIAVLGAGMVHRVTLPVRASGISLASGRFWIPRLLAIVVLLEASASCAATSPDDNARAVGTIVWQNNTIRAGIAAGFDGSSVFVIDTARRLHALSRGDGSIQWSLALTATAFPQRVDAASGIVLIAAGSLIAIDTQTRSERWRVNTAEGLGYLPFTLDGTTVYPTVYFGTGDALALDLLTGTERWRVNIMPPDSVVGAAGNVRTLAPAVHNGLVAVPFRYTRAQNDRGTTGVAVVDAATGRLRWTRVLPITAPIPTSQIDFSVAMNDSLVIMPSVEGFVYAFSVVDGSLRWTGPQAQRLGAAGPITPDSRQVLLSGSTVLVSSGVSVLSALDVNTGAVRWRADVDNGGINAMEPLSGGLAVTRHYNGALTAVDVATGRRMWYTQPLQNSGAVYPPRTAQDTIIAAGRFDGVIVYRVR